MSVSLTKNFSGIVLNQNVPPVSGNFVTVNDDLWRYQTFILPSDYPRGADEERSLPDLSGFHLNVSVSDAETATLDWIVQSFAGSAGWYTLAEGTSTGSPAEGDHVWFETYFDESVTISEELVPDRFRIGFKSPAGGSINKVWFSSPNPLLNSFSQFTASDGSAIIANGQDNVSALFRILALTADEGEDMLGNKYRSTLQSMPATNVDPMGTTNSYWLSHPNPSRFAVESMCFDMRDNADKAVTVDGLLIDPLTPGMWANVYYTLEGDPGTTEDEWDNKLWTRVPQSWKLDKRENITFPDPIVAKYIKVEFSHLQARHYSPGRFARPVLYKKHPKWVLNYFLIRLADANAKSNSTTSNRVRVVYDALDLAYNYYLDDLKQNPSAPVVTEADSQDTVGKFLTTSDALDQKIDATMLSQITLATRPYKTSILETSSDSLLSRILNVNSEDVDEPVEVNVTGSLANVSPALESLAGQPVAFENDYPVMFFYLPCRHAYREVMAAFDYDKAYFAGVREIAFIRNQYTTARDSTTYVEVGADLVNTDRNDFTNGAFARSGYDIGDLGASYFNQGATSAEY